MHSSERQQATTSSYLLLAEMNLDLRVHCPILRLLKSFLFDFFLISTHIE